MDNKNLGKTGIKYYCEYCNVTCRDNYNLQLHYKSVKHNRITMDNENKGIKVTKANKEKIYICECGKNYMFRSGLSKHKKTCKYIKELKEQEQKKEQEEEQDKKEEQDKEEQDKKNDKKDDKKEEEHNRNQEELIGILKEQNKKIEKLEETIKDIPIQQNITNNNQFNLNIFLNEKCKDAINILEFKNMVKEAIIDLTSSVELNVNDAITNAINISYNNLHDLKKPYYTIDKSRKKLAVKDENNEWVKDNADIVYNNMKTLQDPYFKGQLEEFYKTINDRENMTEQEKDRFINLIHNSTEFIDKNKLLNKVVENGINPKTIKS